jgi:putative ABC transport system permease protein
MSRAMDGTALADEARSVFRRLVRRPGFWVPAGLTLALGIGTAAAVFTVLDTICLKPLPYPGAGRLMRLQSPVPGTGGPPLGLAKAEFLFFENGDRAFQALGLYLIDRATVGVATAGQPPEQIYAAAVSDGLPGVLGIHPLLGRAPSREDGLIEKPSVAWLGEKFWRRRFGGDSTLVGRTLLLDGSPVQVAGILPAAAQLPEEIQFQEIRVDLWTPLRLDPAEAPQASHRFRALGRLKAGIDLPAAQTELTRLTWQLPQALPSVYSQAFLRKTGFTTEAVPLRDDVLGDQVRMLWILFGAAGLVLLVACGNAANLFLAEAEAERREMAVRAALGAGRGRLALHLLFQALLLSLLAGALSLWLTQGAIHLLLALSPSDLPRLSEVRLGWEGVLFTALVALVIGGLFGLLPSARQGLESELLGTAGRGMTISGRQRAARNALVIAQVALSLVLLAAAGLLFRSFRNLTSVRPGFEPRGVLTFHVVLPESRYESFAAVDSFERELATRLGALPGIEATGLTSALPLTGFDGCSSVYAEPRPVTPGEGPPCLPIFFVGPGYFRALGVPLRGKAQEWSDGPASPSTAVASAALAQRLWPGQDPLGKAIGGDPTVSYRVAGVAGDLRANGLDHPPIEALYLPLSAGARSELGQPLRDVTVVVRTASERPDRMVPGIRRAVADLDPGVPVAEVRLMEEILRSSTARISFSTLLLGVSSGVALLLAALGIYGLLAFLIARRYREIGIRLALGARREQVRRLVLVQSLRLAITGVVLGLVGVALTTRLLRSLLFGVDPLDPLTLGAAAAFLVTVAFSASWMPARRAMAVPPLEALRHE